MKQLETELRATYVIPGVLYVFDGWLISEPETDVFGNDWVLFRTKTDGHVWSVLADRVRVG